MAQLPTQRIGAHLRKMAIDGYIIYTETADIKQMNKQLSAISRNINQIAKKLNAGGTMYQVDMKNLRDNRTTTAIILNMPAETSTQDISRKKSQKASVRV